MHVPIRVCGGHYITDNTEAPDIDISQTLYSLDAANKLVKPIIIFDNIHIIRELIPSEKSSRQVLEKFIRAEIEQPEVKIGQAYQEVIRFKEAVKLLKDKEKVNRMLPVPVESIAFIEMNDTDGDFILSKEAEFVDNWKAINGNVFNIYKLW